MITKLLSSQAWLRKPALKYLISPLVIVALGLAPAVSQEDPYSMDSDGDGYSDGEENDGGYDAWDPNSYPGYEYSIDSDGDGFSDYDEELSGSDPYDSANYPGSYDPTMEDSDGDGYTDDEENSWGSDPNDPGSYPNSYADYTMDSDSDGWSDTDEETYGTDPWDSSSYPGSADYDYDSDGDGYSDYEEEMAGTNVWDSSNYPGSDDGSMSGDDPSMMDDDGDGYTNQEEADYGSNPNDSLSYPGSEQQNYEDPWSTDSDGDGLYDADEESYGTDPNDSDTDNDGLDDYIEVYGIEVETWYEDEYGTYSSFNTYYTDPNNPDTDGDLLSDSWEVSSGYDPTSSYDGNQDADGDGLSTGQEVATYGTNPNDPDTDIDGEWDGYEVAEGTDPTDQSSRSSIDTDGDVMSDDWETEYGFDLNDGSDASLDFDGDGMSNLREYLEGTNPNELDSDGDGYNDYLEWVNGFNPMNASDGSSDWDGDSMPDLWEIKYGLDHYYSNEWDDYDGDGLYDYEEYAANLDPTNQDTNGDGISDYDEVYGPDPYSLDSDGDGLSDGEENDYGTDPGISDTDNDGLGDYEEINGVEVYFTSGDDSWSEWINTDPLTADSDNDLLEDGFEIYNGFDPNDPSDGGADDDLDNLSNGEEVSTHGTDWQNADTDNDGVSDGLEIAQGTDPLDPQSSNDDQDNDLMKDSWETAHNLDPSDPSDASLDSDNDGLTNLEEFQAETNPFSPDSDQDGYQDHFELINGKNPADPLDATDDGDGDGMPDLWEVLHGLDRTSPEDATGDLDLDMLSNYLEFLNGTLPNNDDTDKDGLLDYTEVNTDYAAQFGLSEPTYTDPLNPDFDNDQLPDGLEVAENYNPFDPADGLEDRDGDGLNNGDEVGIHLTDWKKSDTDGDGEDDGYELAQSTNPLDRISRTSVDSDGDHMSDEWETLHQLDPQVQDGTGDPDDDGLSNYGEYLAESDPHDADSDDDGYADGFERSNGKNPNDPADANDDFDGDGMPDLWEIAYGLAPNNPDDAGADNDNDSLTNLIEFQSATNPNEADSDGDGLSDAIELAGNTSPVSSEVLDSDGDGMSDEYENFYGLNSNDAGDAGADVSVSSSGSLSQVIDIDGDGVSNYAEMIAGTDPTAVDSDGDGQSDAIELLNGSDPTDENVYIAGSDGSPIEFIDDATGAEHLIAALQHVEDRNEYTSPISVEDDADRDGMPDSWEISHGLNPADPEDAWRDFDYDRIINRTEYINGSDPNTDWTFEAIADGLSYNYITQTNGKVLPHAVNCLRGDGTVLSVVPGPTVFQVSVWSNGAWVADGNLGETGTFDSVGQVVTTEQGMIVAVVGKRGGTGNKFHVEAEIRVRDTQGNLSIIGNDPEWPDVTSNWRSVTELWVTESGFVAGLATSEENYGSRSIPFRWREGILEIFGESTIYNGTTNAYFTNGQSYFWPAIEEPVGISENGEFADAEQGVLQGETWTPVNGEIKAVGPYGELWTVPSTQGYDTSRYTINRFGDRLNSDININGYPNVKSASFTGGSLPNLSLTHLGAFDNNYDFSAYQGQDVTASEGIGNYDIYESIYDEDGNFIGAELVESIDFDSDDDGWTDNVEQLAGTDAGDSSSFPGYDGMFLDDFQVFSMNDLGDVAGTVFHSDETSPESPTSGSNGFMWRPRDFALGGIGEESSFVAINNSGQILASQTSYVDEIAYEDFDGDGVDDPYSTGNQVAETTWGILIPTNDSDGNGLPDDWESFYGASDPDSDPDLDTLTTRMEYVMGTHPLCSDTDQDGLPDAVEIKFGSNPLRAGDELLDNDFDGLSNLLEYELGSDLLSSDSDRDGMPDNWEYANMPEVNPTIADANNDPDNDGLTNFEEYTLGLGILVGDTDGDGMPDGWESNYAPTLNPLVNDADEDPDGDNLTNYLEYLAQTDPTTGHTDSDGDGMPDDFELQYGFDIAFADDADWDFDDDGLSNLQEFLFHHDPTNPDTNGDGTVDGKPAPDDLDGDTDQDGMPNGYEAEQGFVYLDPRDGFFDFDGDGYTNREEFVLETNPKSDPLYEQVVIGGPGTAGTGLGDDGLITGVYRHEDGTLHGFTWAGGVLSDTGGTADQNFPVPPPATSASDITYRNRPLPVESLDDEGIPMVIVFDHLTGLAAGHCENALGQKRPFLWRDGNTMDLDDLVNSRNWYISEVIAFNSAGQILAQGYQNGLKHLLLLNPLTDVDGDKMSDQWESDAGLNPYDASDESSDQDSDDLTAVEEYRIGTLPGNSDTDADGISDGQEIHFGLNPINPADAILDHDFDQISNLDEINAGTHPHGNWSIAKGSSLSGELVEVLGLTFSNAILGSSTGDGLTQYWMWNEDGTEQGTARALGSYQGELFDAAQAGDGGLIVGRAGAVAAIDRNGYLSGLAMPNQDAESALQQVNRYGVATGYNIEADGTANLFRYNLESPRIDSLIYSPAPLAAGQHLLASSGSVLVKYDGDLTRFRIDGTSDSIDLPETSIMHDTLIFSEWSDFGRVLASAQDYNHQQRNLLYSFETSSWQDLHVSSNSQIRGQLKVSETNGALMLVGSSEGGAPFLTRESWSADHGTIDINSLLTPGDRESWEILTADAVNDKGVIAGLALHEGALTPYILSPDRDINQDGTVDDLERQYFGDFSGHPGVNPDQGIIGGDGTGIPGTITANSAAEGSTIQIVEGDNQVINPDSPSPPGAIVIEILDSANQPVTDVELQIIPDDPGVQVKSSGAEFSPQITIQTDATGRASFEFRP